MDEIAFELDAEREDRMAESFHELMEKVKDKQAEANMRCYGSLLLCPTTLLCMCSGPDCAGYAPGKPAPAFCGDRDCEYCGPAREDWDFWKDAYAARSSASTTQPDAEEK